MLALYLDRVHYPPHLKRGTEFSNNTTQGKRLRELKGNKRGREKRKVFLKKTYNTGGFTRRPTTLQDMLLAYYEGRVSPVYKLLCTSDNSIFK